MWWGIPSSQALCRANNETVTCNYRLYSNATTLTTAQKLQPNKDVTGRKLMVIFLVTACIALLASLLLLVDKMVITCMKRRDHLKRRIYGRVVHTLDSLLHSISDGQIIAGLALLLTINSQSCSITAYHYNLACTMLLLSIVTHLNALIAIPSFFHKGKNIATLRVLAIAAQVILTAMIFSARHSVKFPTKASSLAIMPAACFENMNATDLLGFDDLIDIAVNLTSPASSSDFLANLEAVSNSTPGFAEYIVLCLFIAFTCILLLLDWFVCHSSSKKQHQTRSTEAESSLAPWARGISIFLAGLSLVASIYVVIRSVRSYFDLMDAMEIEKWYSPSKTGDWTYAQFMNAFLLGGSSLTLVKAFHESYTGARGPGFNTAEYRREVKMAERKLERYQNASESQEAMYVEMQNQNTRYEQ